MVNGLYGVSANASIDHYRLKEVMGDDGGRCDDHQAAPAGAQLAGPAGCAGSMVL